ncbi:MAG: ECF-type sigma factor [Planctomycetota bacterium]
MPSEPPLDVTALLERHARADPEARQQLFAALYDDLRAVARRVFRGDEATLQPTALVHEAWMRFVGGSAKPADRQAFLALAAHVMRHVLVDHARARSAVKRGGGARPVTLDVGQIGARAEVDPADLGECLDKLAGLNERHARVVELRVLAGMTIAETAAELGVGHSTVESDWAMARAWLRTELAPD